MVVEVSRKEKKKFLIILCVLYADACIYLYTTIAVHRHMLCTYCCVLILVLLVYTNTSLSFLPFFSRN
jgi:hypothetical protein